MKQETQYLLTDQQAIQFENEILAQLCNGTLGEWLQAIQSKLPYNIGIKEHITHFIHSASDLNALVSNFEAGNSYFYMPCFELTIDQKQTNLYHALEYIKQHFDIHQLEISDNLLHVRCQWYEGAIVSNKEHITYTCLNVHDSVMNYYIKNRISISQFTVCIDLAN